MVKMGLGRRTLTLILSISVLLIFILNFIAMIILSYTGTMSGSFVPFYVIAVPLVFVTSLPPQYEIYWIIFLATIITIVVFFIIRDFLSWILEINRKEISKDGERFAKFTELVVVLISFTYLTYFISMALMNSSTPFGNPTGNLPVNYMLLTLLHAPVWEEIVYRAFILGLPLYIIAFRGKIPWYRAFTGGKFEINRTSIIILIISAFFFGSAHLVSWEPAKFPSAFFAGIILGYLFLRYGIYMSIAGHFIIDFTGSYSYINTPFWSAMVIVSSLVLMIWFAAGFPYYWYYLKDLLKIQGKKAYAQPYTYQQPYQNYYQTQQNYVLGYKVICPNCGFDQHRVLPDGRYQCLRCGTVFYYNYKK